MEIKQAYDAWAAQYDTNLNKTRDLEGLAPRLSLAKLPFSKVLEIGCGTGKNTEWLISRFTMFLTLSLLVKSMAFL